ncbi:MAG: hypothetical protein K6C05_10315, partial [Anaerovibrio sp.]|uniref:hypothetical protein n=1 Tax=Anaerovibrio sp. TaxID=1872532 RepID=UPI0025FEBE63
SFKMSPSSLGGGKQTTTAGEHISQLVETLIGRFFFLGKKNLNNGVIKLSIYTIKRTYQAPNGHS